MNEVNIKDCRTCPMRQEDPAYSDRDFTYFCNLDDGKKDKIILQLAPESVQSDKTFLPENCPMKENEYEIKLVVNEETTKVTKIKSLPVKEKENS